MRQLMRVTALVLAAAIAMPGVAFADPSLQQQVKALQKEMTSLVKENARERSRINALEHRLARHPSARANETVAATPAKKVAPQKYDTIVPATSTVKAALNSYQAPQVTSSAYPAAPSSNTDAMTTQTASTTPGTTYGSPAPSTAAVNSVYQQENAVFNKGFTVTEAATYTYGDNQIWTLNGFMALGAIFLGNLNVSQQQNSLVEPNVNVAYGISRRLQFDVTVPFVYRSATYISQGAQSSTALPSARIVKTGAIGDLDAGFYYQLHQSRLSDPTTIVNAHVTIPTGTSPYGIKLAQDPSNNNLSYAVTLPTGQGSYGMQVGATMIKTVDPAVIFGGLTYNYNFVGHHPDISPYASLVQPGSVQLGDGVSFTLGTAFSLNDRLSTSFSFQDSIVGQSQERVDGGPWSAIVGSSLNAAVFNIGATYAMNRNVSYQMLLGIGMTKDAPNFQLTFRVPHYL